MTAPKVILSIKESDKMLPLTPIQFFRNLTVDEQMAVLEVALQAIEYEMKQDPLFGAPILDIDTSLGYMCDLVSKLSKYMNE